MARIRIEMPGEFSFETKIPVRITDLNYGNHVGNDTILSILHEARVQYLQSFGLGELSFAGASLIMSDVAIEFKNELYYGETILASVQVANFSKVSFEVYYKLEKESGEKRVVVTLARTGMVCYNYDQKKIVAVPALALKKMQG
jgi:acyl-CoA thioesterase FadM